MNTPIQNVTILLDEHMTGAKRLFRAPVSSAFLGANVTVLLFVPLPVPSIAYEPSFFEKLTTGKTTRRHTIRKIVERTK